MKFTKEQAIAEHRKMWNWIADQLDNGAESDIYILKEQYCYDNNFHIMHNCFCCAYDAQFVQKYSCKRCPVLWGTEGIRSDFYCETGMDGDDYELSLDDEFGLWLIAQNLSEEQRFKEAAEIARQIANLPENPEA